MNHHYRTTASHGFQGKVLETAAHSAGTLSLPPQPHPSTLSNPGSNPAVCWKFFRVYFLFRSVIVFFYGGGFGGDGDDDDKMMMMIK